MDAMKVGLIELIRSRGDADCVRGGLEIMYTSALQSATAAASRTATNVNQFERAIRFTVPAVAAAMLEQIISEEPLCSVEIRDLAGQTIAELEGREIGSSVKRDGLPPQVESLACALEDLAIENVLAATGTWVDPSDARLQRKAERAELRQHYAATLSNSALAKSARVNRRDVLRYFTGELPDKSQMAERITAELIKNSPEGKCVPSVTRNRGIGDSGI